MSAPAARIRPMRGRDRHEDHRAASSLELLFDLTFVVAFGFAGDELAHAIGSGHAGAGVLGFALAMFAICWAWINFSWFASAFDVDDWVYRLVTMVQMVGVLILTLGIPAMFESVEEGGHLHIGVMVLGYVVMRVAMIAQWLRAARQSPAYAATCRAYAIAIAVAQIGWIALIFAPLPLGPILALCTGLFVVELAGPVLAERREQTPWHAHHIAERYGLLAIITLGEGIVGSLAALSAVIGADGWTWQVAALGTAGVGLTFGIWWSYFTLPAGPILHRFGNARALVWGYGSMVVFAAIAAVGAGLHVAALQIEGTHGEEEDAVSAVTAVLSVAVPVAVYVVVLFALYSWLVGEVDRFHLLLLAGAAVFCALPVALAAAGVETPLCLLLLMLAPVVVVVGYETVGHRHEAEVLERLEGRAAG